MIARIRALLARSGPTPAAPSDVLAARDTRIAQLEAKLAAVQRLLSKEQMLNVGLSSDVHRQAGQIAGLRLKLDVAEGEAARLRTDHTYVQAERCECGGDAELYWRRQTAAAEAQAGRDRANAVRLTDEVERLRLLVDEAERLHHIVEQIERGTAVTA